MERTKHSNKNKPTKLVKNYETFTDETLMPFGVYKDKAMANVPAWYLINLYKKDICYGALKAYIQDNLDALEKELKNERNA